MESDARTTKNDSFRKLEISNYRNIGLFDERAMMTLNQSLEKDKLGSLVILVGPNNSGKSNVLDALLCLGNGEIKKTDYCDFYYDSNVKPKIRIVVRDQDDYYNVENNPPHTSTPTVRDQDDYYNVEKDSIRKIEPTTSERFIIVSNLLQNNSFFKSYNHWKIQGKKNLIDYFGYNNPRHGDVPSESMYSLECTQIKDKVMKQMPLDELEISFLDKFHDSDLLRDKGIFLYGDFELRSALMDADFMKEPLNHGHKITKEKSEKSQKNNNVQGEKFLEKFGYDYIPSIIRYEQREIKQSNLQCTYLELNPFHRSLLKLLNKSPEGLLQKYEISKERGQSNLLTTFEAELNKVLSEAVTSKFNKMYIMNNEEYVFRFKLNDETINFEIYRGSTPLNLDFQSTGFKWFFEFFFNFVCNNELKWGDIVIMDEPATNLHVSGQIELRKFLKEFGRSSGLTFIISTHSPFLIDCDHLEEVRLMEMKANGGVTIRDKFSGLPDDTMEQSNEIFKALTVGRHIIMDPSSRLYFVEGITDYNYLTAFKKLLGITNVYFLPINGLKQEDFIPRLMDLDKEPVLIVDGDGAGKEIVTRAKDTGVKVISLSEVKPNFRNIEDLFTKGDYEKFEVADKSFNKTSVFKNCIFNIADELSPTTKKNFEEVLKYLEAA